MIRRAREGGTPHVDVVVAAAVVLAWGGAAVWSAALLAGPVLRPDLDVLTTHPEAYADGAWGPLMRPGYAGIAVAG
ncbi:MAG: hypothetical protein P8Z68_12960 [Kineosporiaceae bacterium]|jgi:hypothetical protein